MADNEELFYLRDFSRQLEDMVDAFNFYLNRNYDLSRNKYGEISDPLARELKAIIYRAHELRWRIKGWVDDENKKSRYE